MLTLKSFEHDFNYTASSKTRVSSLAVALQQLGAFVACFAIWPVTHRLGRKWALVACAAIFCVGVVLETVRSRSIAVFYAGRVVCGLGIGGSATVIPIYLGEMSPKESRARLGSCRGGRGSWRRRFCGSGDDGRVEEKMEPRACWLRSHSGRFCGREGGPAKVKPAGFLRVRRGTRVHSRDHDQDEGKG